MSADLETVARLAELAGRVAGTPEGDAVVTAVDVLRRTVDARVNAPGAPVKAATEPQHEPRPGERRTPQPERAPQPTSSPAAQPEPFVVVLATDDPLAARDEVEVAELAERHLLHNPDEVPEWREVATELRGPTIRTSASFALGPLSTLSQQLDHVAASNGILIVPSSRLLSAPRGDVAVVAVIDIPHRVVPPRVRARWRRVDTTA